MMIKTGNIHMYQGISQKLSSGNIAGQSPVGIGSSGPCSEVCRRSSHWHQFSTLGKIACETMVVVVMVVMMVVMVVVVMMVVVMVMVVVRASQQDQPYI